MFLMTGYYPVLQAKLLSSDRHGSKSPTEIAKEHRSRLSDLPKPEGDWQKQHQSQNQKWMIFLGLGIAALGITVYAVSRF